MMMSQIVSSDLMAEQQSRTTSLNIKACDMCRRKKIRCEATSGSCLQCTKYKTRCHFTPISLKRRPRQLAGDKRVGDLEKRLKSMEEQLKRAIEGQRFETDIDSSNESRGLSMASSGLSPDGISYLLPNTLGDNQYDRVLAIAGLSSESVDLGSSPQKTSIATVPGRHNAISPWDLTSISHSFKRPLYKTLPPKDETLNLIKKSFRRFNATFPLFDQAAFMRTFESKHTDMNDPAWWACVNVVLALTHRFDIFDDIAALDNRKCHATLGYFQNAFTVVDQLLTMQPTLWSVQALLGMSIIVQGAPNQRSVALLNSSAIKIAQSMGLHKRCQDYYLSGAEIEQRKRVFWIAYVLDKDISLQTGHPPAQDDDDMDLDLPFDNNPTESNNTDLFNCRIRLALIQSQIYRRLCSVRAGKQSIAERIIAAKELEAMLQTWRTSVNLDFRQDYWRENLQLPQSKPTLLHIIIRLTYFKALATIYSSLPITPSNLNLDESPDPTEIHTMQAPILYVAEARKAIKLLQITPHGEQACVRGVLHIFLSATTILLTHTLSHPSHPFALADLKLVDPLLALVSDFSQSDESNEFLDIHRSYKNLYDRATLGVNQFHISSHAGWQGPVASGQQAQGRESVEDFLKRIERISSG